MFGTMNHSEYSYQSFTLGSSKQPVWLKPEGTDVPKLKLLNSLTRRKVGGCEVIRTVS